MACCSSVSTTTGRRPVRPYFARFFLRESGVFVGERVLQDGGGVAHIVSPVKVRKSSSEKWTVILYLKNTD